MMSYFFDEQDDSDLDQYIPAVKLKGVTEFSISEDIELNVELELEPKLKKAIKTTIKEKPIKNGKSTKQLF